MLDSRQFIVVTGGATGIGRALALRFLGDGHRVLIVGRRASQLAAVQSAEPKIETAVCDVANNESRRRLIAQLTTETEPPSVLVNNAAIQSAVDFALTPPSVSDVTSEVAINLIAPLVLSAEFLPLLRRASMPTIVNVTSGLAFCPIADVGIYCATKAALHSATLSMRHQLRGVVRIVELIPPIVDTTLSGDRGRSAHTPIMPPEAFADEAVSRFYAGEDEIAVGLAVNLRARGEAVFASLNS